MRFACLLFLFALLAAVLAKPRSARTRPDGAPRSVIVRLARLLVRIASLQLRLGILYIRYGALVLLAAILTGFQRRSMPRQPARQPRFTRVRQVARDHDQHRKRRPCAAQGWPCRADTAHAQTQARARQRAGSRQPRRRPAVA